jgi:hypothetical protein
MEIFLMFMSLNFENFLMRKLYIYMHVPFCSILVYEFKLRKFLDAKALYMYVQFCSILVAPNQACHVSFWPSCHRNKSTRKVVSLCLLLIL